MTDSEKIEWLCQHIAILEARLNKLIVMQEAIKR